MDIPAWAFSNLCIGRTYDSKENRAGIDIFQPEIATKTENVNRFYFQYKVIESNKDVKDLLNISGDISLKTKAGIFNVNGVGNYIKNSSKDEKVTEVLVVVKCTTVTKTMDGLAEAKKETIHSKSLGNFYVRSVTYGAEMVASLKFKSSSSSLTANLTGQFHGGLDTPGIVSGGFESLLDKLASDCNNADNLSTEYYATDVPDKIPTNPEDLLKLIKEFPSRLKEINAGQGVPIMFELQPIHNVFPTIQLSSAKAMESELEEFEIRFDDLREARRLVSEYAKEKEELEDDITTFSCNVNKAFRGFRKAVNHLDDENVEKCLAEYQGALGGHDIENKYVMYWRNLLKKKSPTTDIKLPSGKELTVVVLGKTGNGKSATANKITGGKNFTSSPAASSFTKHCDYNIRKLERCIRVIDTPGVLDTSKVTLFLSKWLDSQARIVEKKILEEVHKMFHMAPTGFDAILLVVQYGTRFSEEDSKALTLLIDFLGSESKAYMILLLTHGDQAKRLAKKEGQSPKEFVDRWITTLPMWVRDFVSDIEHRVVLFDNSLDEDEDPEGCKKEVSQLIETIDKMNSGKSPFVHALTEASKEVLDERIQKALNSIGLDIKLEKVTKEKEDLENMLAKKDLPRKERNHAQDLLKQVKGEIAAETKKVKELEAEEKEKQAQEAAEGKSGGKATENVKSGGGCFPGSSTFVDRWGSRKEMHSLQIGEKVQVVSNGSICLEPVISFIHLEQEKLQEFLSITTTNNSNLKITEDHLLFVEKNGLQQAIPARSVKIGDKVYVKQNELIGTGTVKDVSIVYEKGVYAPVTSSGTILINDVHTSCYFDVLSHEWSHRAMGVVRAVYHASPWMLQWISSVGEKDGFPGWVRLANKMLTFMD